MGIFEAQQDEDQYIATSILSSSACMNFFTLSSAQLISMEFLTSPTISSLVNLLWCMAFSMLPSIHTLCIYTGSSLLMQNLTPSSSNSLSLGNNTSVAVRRW